MGDRLESEKNRINLFCDDEFPDCIPDNRTMTGAKDAGTEGSLPCGGPFRLGAVPGHAGTGGVDAHSIRHQGIATEQAPR